MARFEFEDTVKLKVDRVAGTKNDTCEVFASSNTALVKGLCWLVEESAKYMKMTKQELLCRLAVVLMGVTGEEAERK